MGCYLFCPETQFAKQYGSGSDMFCALEVATGLCRVRMTRADMYVYFCCCNIDKYDVARSLEGAGAVSIFFNFCGNVYISHTCAPYVMLLASWLVPAIALQEIAKGFVVCIKVFW